MKVDIIPANNKPSIENFIKQCEEQIQKATGIPYSLLMKPIPANEYAKQFLEFQINIKEFTNKILPIFMKEIKSYKEQLANEKI
jgi:adenine C2-methylase RlmN of 23S rRNA A2503 and tRNA A37